MYALVNTLNSLPGDVGTAVSLHRSVEAAEQANARLQRQVRAANGRDAYLPTLVYRLSSGRARPYDRLSRERVELAEREAAI